MRDLEDVRVRIRRDLGPYPQSADPDVVDPIRVEIPPNPIGNPVRACVLSVVEISMIGNPTAARATGF